MSLHNNSFNPDLSPGLVDLEETSIPRIGKDDIVVVDNIVPTQMFAAPDTAYCCKGKRYFFWILLTLGTACTALGIALLLVGFSEDQERNDEPIVYDRQGYYEYLQETFLPLTGSSQDQAIEWLAFQDTPLEDSERNRIMERFALVAWYFAHGGPTTWNSINDSHSGWIKNGVGIHECQWRGVDCNISNEVTGLRLPAGEGITLTGSSLSTEIGLLTSLQYFDVANQRLQGAIPSDWEVLTNMVMLNLSNNQISSTIPSFMGKISSLQSLMLGGNYFTGSFPQTIFESDIGAFYLMNGHLLDRSSFQLTRAFEPERLELQDNLGFGGQVEQLFKSMPKLSHLDISSTSISGSLPSPPLSNLKVLQAWGSLLTGTLPSDVGGWTNLSESGSYE
jgi:hypothetical protein